MHTQIRIIRLITKNYYLYKGLYHVLSQRGYTVMLFDEFGGIANCCDMLIYSLFEVSDPDIQKTIQKVRSNNADLYTVVLAHPHISTMTTCKQRKIIVSNQVSGLELCRHIKYIDSRKIALPELSKIEKEITSMYLAGYSTKQISLHLEKPLKSIYSIRKRVLTKIMLPNFNSLIQAHHLI